MLWKLIFRKKYGKRDHNYFAQLNRSMWTKFHSTFALMYILTLTTFVLQQIFLNYSSSVGLFPNCTWQGDYPLHWFRATTFCCWAQGSNTWGPVVSVGIVMLYKKYPMWRIPEKQTHKLILEIWVGATLIPKLCKFADAVNVVLLNTISQIFMRRIKMRGSLYAVSLEHST